MVYTVLSWLNNYRHKQFFDILKELIEFVKTYRVFDIVGGGSYLNEHENKTLMKLFEKIKELKLPSAESIESVRKRSKKMNETEFLETCNIL